MLRKVATLIVIGVLHISVSGGVRIRQEINAIYITATHLVNKPIRCSHKPMTFGISVIPLVHVLVEYSRCSPPTETSSFVQIYTTSESVKNMRRVTGECPPLPIVRQRAR